MIQITYSNGIKSICWSTHSESIGIKKSVCCNLIVFNKSIMITSCFSVCRKWYFLTRDFTLHRQVNFFCVWSNYKEYNNVDIHGRAQLPLRNEWIRKWLFISNEWVQCYFLWTISGGFKFLRINSETIRVTSACGDDAFSGEPSRIRFS